MSPRTSSAREPERRHPHPGSSRTRRNARMASPWLGYHSGSWRCSLRQRDHAVVAGRLAAEVVVLADARLVAVVALGHLDDRAGPLLQEVRRRASAEHAPGAPREHVDALHRATTIRVDRHIPAVQIDLEPREADVRQLLAVLHEAAGDHPLALERLDQRN